MKPKISCTQCGSVLARTDVSCPSCGVAVDWTELGSPVWTTTVQDSRTRTKQGQQSQSPKSSDPWPSRSIFAGIALLAIALLVYVLVEEKRPVPEAVQPQAGQPAGGTMVLPPEIQELENSVAANPDNMGLTLQLANALHDGLLYERAVPYYQSYLKSNPKDADARVDLGICYKELGKYTDAENEMKTALHYVPNHLHAHFNLGIVYLSEGNIEESNKWFKRTVALDPNSEVGKRAQQLLTQHNSQPTKTE